MKVTLALIFGLIYSLQSSAQYHPFIEDNKKWITISHEYVWLPGNPIPATVAREISNQCLGTADTSINNLTYRQLFNCSAGYSGALREENRKVWLVPADSTHEYLVYDFGASVGDTLKNVYEEVGSFGMVRLVELIVNQIDSVEIGNSYRKSIYLANGAGFWIEGIGNNYGLFKEVEPNVSNYGTKLTCTSTSDTRFYPDYVVNSEPCENMYLGIAESTVSRTFQLSPNPGNGDITVQFPNDHNGTLTIFDSSGKNVYTSTVNTNSLVLDSSNLPEGFYQIRFTSQGGVNYVQKYLKY